MALSTLAVCKGVFDVLKCHGKIHHPARRFRMPASLHSIHVFQANPFKATQAKV